MPDPTTPPRRPVAEPGAANAFDLFGGAGEMQALCRAFDWGTTPLGPIDAWSRTLRTATQIVLQSGLPQIVLWGRGLIQIYNDAYARLIRGKHPAALGHGNLEIWPEVAHINAPIFDRVFLGETVTREDALYPLERSGVLEDVYLTISYSPIREPDGTVGGVLATMVETTRNVTLRKLQKERERLYRELELQRNRLEEAFRQAPAFIATLRGPDHVFEMANPPYIQLVGGRPVVGLPVREALPEVESQGFVELLDRVYVSGEPFVGNEVGLLLERGPGGGREERFLNFVYQPLCDVDGAVEGILVHGVDVSDLVRARRRLKAQAAELKLQAEAAEQARHAAEEAGREAARANQAKSDFLATMSHELRTPLNAIIGYSDLLIEGIPQPLGESARRNVGRISTSARHLRELIEEVLTFSRLEAGEERPDLGTVDVATLLEEVHALNEPLALEKGLVFSCDPPTAPISMRSDARKVRQILINLVGNAIKFTAAGSVRLETAATDRAVVFRVIDTGTGIPAEHQERIFEPFWQVEGGATRHAGGTGLGLSVSRRLARMLGGDIGITSEPGKGSTFTVRLPRDAAGAGVVA